MSGEPQSRVIRLSDGSATTIHVVRHPLASSWVSVAGIAPEAPLEQWCAERGIREAISGGFAVKPEFIPLGELRLDGRPAEYRPFRPPWASRRPALVTSGSSIAIAPRELLPPEPSGGLLQAGPLLVRDGASAVAGVEDPEGFSATSDEFDQDLTDGREPRLAIAVDGEALLLVAADGRTADDVGMKLWEFAELLVELGADHAMNLDGGSAGVVVSGGRRINTPRDDEGTDLELSSPSVTAIVIES